LEEEQGKKNDTEENMELDTPTPSSPPIVIKREQELQALPPMPISPTTATTEKMARLKVMSIGFLCGSDGEEETPPPQSDRRVSDCPLLDLLVDAVMDAEYMDEKKAAAVAAAATTNKQHQQITVVVNPEIHRDATNRVLLQQQLQQQKLVQQQQQARQSLPSSPLGEDSSESKADSAVSLSPRLNNSKEEEDRCWRREMDDGLFNKQKEEDDDFGLLDDFLDDVSDLSSVSSTELSTWTSDDEDEEEEVLVATVTKKVANGKKSGAGGVTAAPAPLACIACSKPLKKQDVSEDTLITNELATWTWSPSAVFTDWRPKRCPRCERHFTIFKQEWPNRKIKKKKPTIKKSKKGKRTAAATAASKKSSRPSSPFPTSSATTTTTTTIAASTTETVEVEQQPQPSTPVHQMQDDPDDLNYIPPSPLSEVQFDDEEDDIF
jgi:hypothetical protein